MVEVFERLPCLDPAGAAMAVVATDGVVTAVVTAVATGEAAWVSPS